MANNYFQFKRFTVHQDHCAMKVCTDACIFGAYVAGKLNSIQHADNPILDIGTGTGLLSLLIAQKTSGIIDSVELDEAAFKQATHNFEQSPWSNRLTIFNMDAFQYRAHKKYDCIICNPPFFEGDLKSPDKKKNAAKHDTTLTLEQLLQIADSHLSPAGFFAVLLPYHRVSFFIEVAAEVHFFLQEQLFIRHTSQHPFFRGILLFSRQKEPMVTNELVIKNSAGNYTPEFIELLRDYYLEEGMVKKVEG